MTRKHLDKIAKLEIAEWEHPQSNMPRGLVLAILFCFIHRATTGETVEESFFTRKPSAPIEYENPS